MSENPPTTIPDPDSPAPRRESAGVLVISSAGAVSLPPFDPNKTCVKCWAWANTHYCSVYYASRHWGAPELNTTSEHMHRTCSRCHYQWVEAPLDTKRLEGPAEVRL